MSGENCQPSMLMGPLHTQEAFSVLSQFYLIFLEPQISSSHHLSQELATVPEIPVLPLALLFSIDNCSSVSVKKQKLSPSLRVTCTWMAPSNTPSQKQLSLLPLFPLCSSFCVPSHFIPASDIGPCPNLPPLCLQKYASLLQPSKWLRLAFPFKLLASFSLPFICKLLCRHSAIPPVPFSPLRPGLQPHDFSSPPLAREFPGQWSLLIPHSITAVGTADCSLPQHS